MQHSLETQFPLYVILTIFACMNDNKVPIIIIGAGTQGRVALDIANSLDVLVYGFLTDDEEEVNKELNDVLVISKLSTKDSNTLLNDENVKIVIAEYDGELRKEYVEYLEKYPPELINLIHPHHVMSEYIKMGRGNIINAGAVVNANAMIGSFNVIDSLVSIEPDAAVGDYCTIQSGVHIGRRVQIHDHVNIGLGAVIYADVHVGKGATIGTGAVVMRDVDEGTTVFGNPAREVDV